MGMRNSLDLLATATPVVPGTLFADEAPLCGTEPEDAVVDALLFLCDDMGATEDREEEEETPPFLLALSLVVLSGLVVGLEGALPWPASTSTTSCAFSLDLLAERV